MNKTVSLNSGYDMPLLGLGVYGITEDKAETAVASAVASGYRLIDTASAYKNEEWIGRAIQRSGIRRDELFITSKVWNNAQRLGDIEGAFLRSLERLKLDYVDLYLIHWPVPACFLSTWQAMIRLLDSRRVRSIGVSNFSIPQLEELRSSSGVVPAVNQIEVHPFCYPKDLISYCQDSGIVVQAYAPLGRGLYLDHDVLCVLATKYGRTTAQIGLRWILQKGIAVIPKSVDPSRIRSNGDLWDFEIQQEDMDILDSLNENLHTSSIPEDLRDVLRW